MERAAQVFEDLNAASRGPASAQIKRNGDDGDVIVHVKRSQLDLKRSSGVPSSKGYLLHSGSENVTPLGWAPGELEAGAAVTSESVSGKVTLRVTKGSKPEDEDLWIEVWRNGSLSSSLKVADKVKLVYNDALFGGLSWNANETKVCFIGEVPAPKAYSSPFIPEKVEEGDAAKDKPQKPSQDNKFLLKENFGETLEEKYDPAIFVFDLEANELERIEGLTDGLVPQQPLFDEDDNVVFQGTYLPGKRLGLNFCLNKATALYLVKDKKDVRRLTPESMYLAFCPRFSNDRSRLVFFGREEVFLSHSTIYELFCLEWSTVKTTAEGTITPKKIVEKIRELPGPQQAFTGLYGYHVTFVSTGFVGRSNRYFLFQAQSKGLNLVFLCDLDKDGSVTQLKLPEGDIDNGSAGYDILALRDSTAVIQVQRFDLPPSVYAIQIKNPNTYVWRLLEAGGRAAKSEKVNTMLLSNCKQEVVTIDNGSEGYLQYNASLEGPRGCVVILHGGPFGASRQDAFLLRQNGLVAMDMAVLVVNYRGSTGYGEDFLEALVGNIGDVDVRDCAEVVKAAINQYPQVIDPKRVGVFGGSHGGFLTGWLIGHPEYKSLFKCGVLWNPVLNLPYEAESTDIPDWVAACALKRPFALPFSAEDNDVFWKKSPASVMKNVTCPTLFLVGASDLRVPPHQSVHAYHVLKSKGLESKLYLYPGSGHALANKEHNIDATLNLLAWFAEKLAE